MQFSRVLKLSTLFNGLLAVGVVSLVVACGGGSNNPSVTIAAANVSAGVTGATAPALVNTPVVFAAGVPQLGTTASTTLTFKDTTATPAFAITTGTSTATGVTTFGSCIFTVTSSTYPAGSALVVGAVIKIDPCTLTVATKGLTAGSTTSNGTATFLLGTTTSSSVTLPVTISSTGVVTINNIGLGTVSVSVTGGN